MAGIISGTVQNQVGGMSVKLSESLVYLLDRRPDGVSSGDERPAGGTNSFGLCTKKKKKK